MTTRTPPDYPLIKRIMEECEKYGGPRELARQLSLNVKLEDRNKELQQVNDSLTLTKGSLLQRIKEFEKQEAGANKRRDDALEESKVLDKQVDAKRKELEELQVTLAKRVNAKNDWEVIHQAMQVDLEKQRRGIISCKQILAPAYWLRSILEQNRPVLYQMEKEYIINFVTKEQPAPPYNDKTGDQIIDYIINELRTRGALVPRLLYVEVLKEARRCADNMREIGRATYAFVHTPEKMSIEQRRALLISVAELDSKESFSELLKQAAEIGARCPLHGVKLSWDPLRRKWICRKLNCTYAI